MSKLRPVGDIKYKSRTYIDGDGVERSVWVTVGTLFSTPHGSNITIKLDTIPVGEWNGWLKVYDREERGEQGVIGEGAEDTHQPRPNLTERWNKTIQKKRQEEDDIQNSSRPNLTIDDLDDIPF